MDRWQSQPIRCSGGLNTSKDVLTQGTDIVGSAQILQNFEPAVEGGYERILGYQPYDSSSVTGSSGTPVLGVCVALGGVFAAKLNVATTDVDIYYSTGSGWTKKNTAGQDKDAAKYRFLYCAIEEPIVIACDGMGYAWKFNGTTDALINGTGAPTDPKYVENFISRVALSGYSSNPSAVSLTAPNTDDDFDGANDAVEFIVGDVVVGLKTFRDALYVFCKRSIWKLTGKTLDDFAVVDVTKKIGCISGDTIQEIGGDLIFLAPDGLRSIAATEKIDDVNLGLVSSNISSTIRPYTDGFTEDSFASCTIPSKSQYRMFVYQTSVSDSAAVGFLCKFTQEGYHWATLAGINAYCADSAYDDDTEVVVFGHPSDNKVYRLEQGSSFNNANIYAIYRSPHLTFSDASVRKLLQKIDIYVKQSGDLNVDLNVIFDLGNQGVLQPQTINIDESGDFPVYGTALYGTDRYASVSFPVFKKNLQGSGFTAAFQYVSNNQCSSYRIDSFQIQFSPKGRR